MGKELIVLACKQENSEFGCHVIEQKNQQTRSQGLWVPVLPLPETYFGNKDVSLTSRGPSFFICMAVLMFQGSAFIGATDLNLLTR